MLADDRQTLRIELMVSSSGGTWRLLEEGKRTPGVPNVVPASLPAVFDPTGEFQTQVQAALLDWLRTQQDRILTARGEGPQRNAASHKRALERTSNLFRYLFHYETRDRDVARNESSPHAGRQALARLAADMGIDLPDARTKRPRA